jgi:hypothetical protein
MDWLRGAARMRKDALELELLVKARRVSSGRGIGRAGRMNEIVLDS